MPFECFFFIDSQSAMLSQKSAMLQVQGLVEQSLSVLLLQGEEPDQDDLKAIWHPSAPRPGTVVWRWGTTEAKN